MTRVAWYLLAIPVSVALSLVAAAVVTGAVLASPLLTLGLAVAYVFARWPMLRWSVIGFVAAMALVGWSEAWGLLADSVRGRP